MSMTMGNNGGPAADMNVTPLIDVLLVLIIIFMVITPMMPTGLDALVPQPPKDPTANTIPDPIRTVVVQVIGSGNDSTLKINQEDVAWDSLQGRLFEIFKTRNERVIFVSADTTLDFAQVARVIDTAHAAGIYNVGLMTERAKS